MDTLQQTIVSLEIKNNKFRAALEQIAHGNAQYNARYDDFDYTPYTAAEATRIALEALVENLNTRTK